MEQRLLEQAARLLEEANAALAPGSHPGAQADVLLAWYVRVERLAAFGRAALAARVGDAAALARVSGTSVGSARRTIETGRSMAREPRLAAAVQRGEVSLDQAAEIARTASVAPQATVDLLQTARRGSFALLRDRARQVRLDAVAGSDLAGRQHRARMLRHWVNDLGMVRIEAALEPHLGARVVSRLEDEARRLARASRTHHAGADGGTDESDGNGDADSGGREPFERYLADALPTLITGHGGDPGRSGSNGGGSGRAEVVVLVSHEVAQRGWQDVHEGEHCKIPGIGPVAPQVARRIAGDAFLSGLFYDGTDLRHLKRWTRHIPRSIRLALQLGEPPDFDGPVCVDCGNRFRLEFDHVHPYAAGGPTSLRNGVLRCDECHMRKTAADRRTMLTAFARRPAPTLRR